MIWDALGRKGPVTRWFGRHTGAAFFSTRFRIAREADLDADQHGGGDDEEEAIALKAVSKAITVD